jgi:hypothetical protein
MGVAVQNISGMTLHSCLMLNQQKARGNGGKSKRDLVAMWQNFDYLLIDEVSMIGCNFLLQISQALSEAKESSDLFGGLNIVFAGDFAQLPPVGQRGLIQKSVTHRVSTYQGQNTLFGKLLWLSISTVVLLKSIMHQQGTENSRFMELLSRLHQGRCSDEDFDIFNSCLLSNVHPDWKAEEWLNAPVIVPTNEVKDAINM